MAKMKKRPELYWVQSHQDDDPDIGIKTLSVGTQLNIKADALATQELDRLNSKPKVPLDPSSKVMLHQQGRAITRDHKVSIQNNIQLLVLEEYY